MLRSPTSTRACARTSHSDFLVSGRQVPRTGGIIIALADSREQIESIMAEDPFCKHGLAEVRVIEFRASQRAPDMPQRVTT
jgi:uncharacterized protein YciI